MAKKNFSEFTYGVGLEVSAASFKQVKNDLKLNLDNLSKMVKDYGKVLKIDPNADLSKLFEEIRNIKSITDGINASDNSFAGFVDKGVLTRIETLESRLQSVSAISDEVKSSMAGLKDSIVAALEPFKAAGAIKLPGTFDSLFGDTTNQASKIKSVKDQVDELDSAITKLNDSKSKFKSSNDIKLDEDALSTKQIALWLKEFQELQEKISNSKGLDLTTLYQDILKLSELGQNIQATFNTLGEDAFVGFGVKSGSKEENVLIQSLSSMPKQIDSVIAKIGQKRNALDAELKQLYELQAQHGVKTSAKQKSLGLAGNEDGSNLILRAKVIPDVKDAEWANTINTTIQNIEPQLLPVKLKPTFSNKSDNLTKEVDGNLAQINHAVNVDLKVTDNLEQFRQSIANIDKEIKTQKENLEKSGNFKIKFEYEDGGKLRDVAKTVIKQFKQINAKLYISNGRKFILDVIRLKEKATKELKDMNASFIIGNRDDILSQIDSLRSEIEKKISNIGINLNIQNGPQVLAQTSMLTDGINSGSSVQNVTKDIEGLSDATKKANEDLEKSTNILKSLMEHGFNSKEFLQLGDINPDGKKVKGSTEKLEKLLNRYKELKAKLPDDIGSRWQELYPEANGDINIARNMAREVQAELKQIESDLNGYLQKQIAYAQSRQEAAKNVLKTEKEIANTKKQTPGTSQSSSAESENKQLAMSAEEATKKIRSLNGTITQQKKVLKDLETNKLNSSSLIKLGEWDKETGSFKKNSKEIQALVNRYKELRDARIQAGGKTATGEEASLRGKLSSILREQKQHVSEIIAKNQQELSVAKQISEQYKQANKNKTKVTKSNTDTIVSSKNLDELTAKLTKAKETLALLKSNKLDALGSTGLGDVNKYLESIGSKQTFEDLISFYDRLIAKKNELEKAGKTGSAGATTTTDTRTGTTSSVVKLDGSSLSSLAKDSTLQTISGKIDSIVSALGNYKIDGSNISINAANVSVSGKGAVGGSTSGGSKNSGSKEVKASTLSGYSQQLVSLEERIKRSGMYTDELKKKFEELRAQLDSIKVQKDADLYKIDLNKFKENFEQIKTYDQLYQDFIQSMSKQKQLGGQIAATDGPTSKLQEDLKTQQEITNNLETQLKINTELYTEQAKQAAIAEATRKAQQELTNMAAAKKDQDINRQNNALIKIVDAAQGKLKDMQYAMQNSKVPMADAAIAKFREYEQLLTVLQVKQKEIAANPDLLKNANYSKDFDNLLQKMQTVNDEFTKLQKSSDNFLSKISSINDIKILDSTLNPQDMDQLHNAMQAFANETGNGTAKLIEFNDVSKTATFEIKSGKGQVQELTVAYDAATNSLGRYTGKTKESLSETQKFMNSLKHSFQNVARYIASFGSVYRIFAMIKRGFTYVKDIDSALTELKKVTDETDASYDKFLQDMSKTAGVVGSTVKDLTKMSAEWARLGYSMQEAGELAESTAILLNVSEFDDATKASEALISTMQAFQYTADESQRVVDILNEVGNNYAVSSDGIATALQDSASALMEAGNNLEQSVALVAAANKVVQDPNSVGSALRTISLRLRGTSVKVLEEMGEETDGVVESTSKLQSKLKALTGVDILTDSGAYKDTYTILKDIGKEWENISNIDQAAALELMAGKNRANTLAAILNNMEDLEDAYNSALDAEDSALKENETYLDSIQGKIDLFTNSVQTMWMKALDSDAVKLFVDLGRVLIDLVSKMGLVKTAFAGLLMYFQLSSKYKLDLASILGFHDMKKGNILGKEGFTGWIVKQFNGIATKFKSKKNIAENILGDSQDVKVSVEEFADAIQDNINRYVDIDTTQIDGEIDSVQNKLQIARQELADAKKADWDYYKSLGSTTPAKDRDARIAEKTQEIEELESKLSSLQAKRDEIVSSAATNVANTVITQTSAEVKSYQSMFDVLGKIQNMELSLGNEQDAAMKIDQMSKAAASGQIDLANYVSTLSDGDIALKAYAASVTDGQYSLAGFQSFIKQHNEGLKASTFAAKAATVAHQVLNSVLSMGIAMLASAIFSGIVKLVNLATHRTENLIEKWNDAKSKIAETNKELDTTQSRIKELEAQGVLSFVDKQELEQLRQTNDELERRLRLEQQSADEAGKKAKAAVEKDYEKNFLKNPVVTQRDTDIVNRANNVKHAIDAYLNNPSYNVFDELSKQQQQLIIEIAPELKTKSLDELGDEYRETIISLSNEFNQILEDYSFMNAPDNSYVSGETYIDQAIQKIHELEDEIYDVNGAVKVDDDVFKHVNDEIGALQTELANASVELYEYIDNYGADASDPFVKQLQAQIDKIDMEINPVQFYDKKFNEIFGKYSDQKVALYELAEQGKLTAASLNSSTYAPFLNELKAIGVSAQDVVDHINSLNELEIKQVTEPTFNIADYADSIDTMQEKMSDYQAALASLEDGTFTHSDLIDLLQKYPELAKGVDVTSKNFKGLAKNLKIANKSAPDELIDDLKQLKKHLTDKDQIAAVDQLIYSLENIPDDTIESLSDKYSTLTDEINAAKKAQNELQEAMSENPNEGYETRGEAMEYMKDKMSRGEIGSESELWSVAEEYGFTFDSAKSINENADALAKFIAIREKWFKQDDDGNYTYEGTEEFITATEKAVQKVNELHPELALEWNYDETTGTFDFDFNNADWDTIVKYLSETEELAGLTSEEFTDLLIQVGQFFDINWQDGNDIVAYLTKLKEEGVSASDRLALMEKSIKTLLQEKGFSIDLLENEDSVKDLPADIQNAILAYRQLKDELKDPLGITRQLETDSETNLKDGLSDKSVESLQQLVSVAHDSETGVSWLSLDDLSAQATKSGMDVEALMEKIEELKNAGKIIDLKTTEKDPLGLVSMQHDATTTITYLEALGLAAQGLDGAFTINLPSFIDMMVAAGWNSSDIQTYIANLNAQGYTFTYTTEEQKTETLDVNTTEGQAKVDELVAKSDQLTDTETLTVNLDGTAEGLLRTMQNRINSLTENPHTVTVNIKTNGSLPRLNGTIGVNGTAHAQGTAYAGGSWGAKKTETALTGELGPELLVRDGRWQTIGDNGAEFTQIKKGDIIFNHKQTEDLLKNGYVTSRGKAYASGTALASGGGTFAKYQFSGNGGFTKYDVNDNVVDTFGDVSDSLSNAAESISDAADEFEEVFDWIEVRLEEVEEAINLLSAQIENATYYSDKNKIIDEVIGANNLKLTNLEAGYKEYADYAAKLLTEIPEKYHDAVKNGAIAIEKFVGEADEATLEAINNYRDWAQKAADLKQQAEEVITTIRDLAIQKIDNAQDSGNVRLEGENLQNEKLQNAIDLIEEMGYVASSAYYGINGGAAASSTGMFENAYKKIEYMTKARDAMQAAFNDAVKAGQIIRGSNEWYEQIHKLYEADAEIDEATKELEEFQNAINEIYWDNFDELINRIDYLKDETQSLIDLMESSGDLVVEPIKRKHDGGTIEFWTEDDVEFTKEGMASLGLYAQQMEIAEYTARQYAEAIDDLEKEFKAGKYSESEYLEKLNELKESQYENIEAYYDAREAIVDLNEARIDSIKDGIEKEIDAYEELIEKKKEALDAEKDLYDFNKSAMEQQKSIADIQRKLAALATDNSASAIAQRKRLEAELAEAQASKEEMYYDRSISNQQEALDKELENFQTEKDAEIAKWEEYLTNIEQVVTDSLGIVQANANEIGQTLTDKANEYNLTVSDAILTPWQDGALAVSDYQTAFDTAMSSTTDQLALLEAGWQKVIDKMQEAAQIEVDNIHAENAKYAEATKEEPKKPVATTTNKTETKKEDTQTTYTVKKGDTLSGIAKKQLGNASRWREIYNLNKGVIGKNPNRIYPGQKLKIPAYAKGTLGISGNQLAWIDELGEELVMHADGSGKLAFLSKGSAVIPHDISENLMKLGALDPSEVLDQNRPSIGLHPEIHNTEIHIDNSVGELIHIDNCSTETLPDVEKIVNKALDQHMKNLNNSLRRYTR